MDSAATTSATLEYAISGLTVGAWIADDEAMAKLTYMFLTALMLAALIQVFLIQITLTTAMDLAASRRVAVSASVKGLGLSYVDGTEDTYR